MGTLGAAVPDAVTRGCTVCAEAHRLHAACRSPHRRVGTCAAAAERMENCAMTLERFLRTRLVVLRPTATVYEADGPYFRNTLTCPSCPGGGSLPLQ